MAALFFPFLFFLFVTEQDVLTGNFLSVSLSFSVSSTLIAKMGLFEMQKLFRMIQTESHTQKT